MARVPYVDPASFSDEDRHLLETRMGLEDLPEEYRHRFSAGARNVHRTIGNNPAVLREFRRMNAAVWRGSGLADRERELVILAVARATDSRYEWHQHVRYALSVGFDPDEIRAIGREDHADFPEEEAALLAYASAAARGEVGDEEYAPLAERFDAESTVGITMLVGAYTGLARTLDAMAVEPEEPFVGWDLDR